MPMRSGSPGVRGRLRPVGVGVRLAVDEMRWHGGLSGRFQETNRGRSRSACRWASTSSSGSDRSASSLAGRGRRSGRTAPTARTSAPRRRRDRAPAVAARPSPNRSSWCRRRDSAVCSRRQAARRTDRARRHREVRRRRRARPSRRRATPGGPAAASPRPCAAGRLPRRGSRCAGVGFAVGVAVAAAARRAPRRRRTPSPVPWVRMRRRRNARSVARSTTSPLVTASSTPPECTCPPVGSRESASASRCRQARIIRTGSIAAPSAVRWPAAPPDLAVDAHGERVGIDLDARQSRR